MNKYVYTKRERTNNDLQNVTQKTKDRATRYILYFFFKQKTINDQTGINFPGGTAYFLNA